MSVAHRLHARCGAAACHHESGSSARGARPFAFPHSPRNFERDRPFQVEHLALDLALDVAKKSVVGTATLHLTRVNPDADEVQLDAIAFNLRSVRLDGARADHRYDGRTITVAIPRGDAQSVITVAYGATPRRGLYFLEPDEQVPDRPRQVWSQCQEEDARYFIPCHDKPHVKMTTELAVRVPNGWSVLSNGALVSKETPRTGAWRFHWKMDAPHPSYLLTLVAGEFDEVEETALRGGAVAAAPAAARRSKRGAKPAARDTVPLSYLVPKGRLEDGLRTFARTPNMVEHFGKITGTPYPWNKYAQVVVSDFIFGGMENTTATTMYEHILLDTRAAIDVTSDDLIAHELAHQWFGDYVTCRDWSEGWLNEGFATFFEHVWREELRGRDEYDHGVKADLDAYLGEATGRYRRPIVCQDYDAPLNLFDRHLYEKGGLVLHTLRVELGDALFWKGTALYLERHARGVVETRDLMRAMEEVSGRSLGKFFEQAVYKPGHPECDVVVSWEKKVLTVSVRQHQSTSDGVPAHFEFPLAIEIHDDAEGVSAKKRPPPRRERLFVTQKTDSFAVPCEARPAFVVVDPEMRILGEVHLKAPNDMLRQQLAKAPTARGRWVAADALATSDDPPTIAALAARLEDDAEMWAVRGACAEALGRIRAQEAFEALARSTTLKHPKVRRAVVAALGRFRTLEAEDAIRPRALSDASYLVEAEAARSLGKTKRPAAFEVLIEAAARSSWADVIALGAIDGLAALRDERALPYLASWTKYGRPTRVRRAALLALPKLDDGRKTREALEDLLGDADPHLRLDVARALGEIGDVKARGALRERLEIDLDPRVRRRLRETLRDLGGDSKKATDQMKDDLEKLQTDHAALKGRLAQLEARVSEEEGEREVEADREAGAREGEETEEAVTDEEAPIRVELRGTVAVWTIDRPDRMNALSRGTLLAFGRLAREAVADPGVRAIVITGAGEKAFCAGADLKERQGMTENDVRVQVELYRSELGPLDRSPKPVVAAINGVAFGGGLELALVADLRVAAEHALLALPETTLGIIPGAGGTQRLPRLVGEARAKEMILLGRRLTAAEAFAWGLVNRVTAKGTSVVDDAVAWIEPIANGAPIAQAAALEAIDRAFGVGLDVGLELEKVSYDKTLVSEDRREALAAFAAKRKPTFTGR